MKDSQAISVFAALAQETRLKILRRLVRAGEGGMSSGALAEALKVSAASMSFHLGHLETAGLVKSKRESRSIIYSADYTTLGQTLQYLMKDCCNDDPRIRNCCS